MTVRPCDTALRLLAASAALLAAGCSAPVPDAQPPPVELCAFERDVYPVLARDCGFAACHGDPARFFRVWAPGRTRLDPVLGPFAPATPEEIEETYDRARAMLATADGPEESLLLRKPLESSAGGAAHMGIDAAGRDVYADRDAPGWQALSSWVHGEGEPCP